MNFSIFRGGRDGARHSRGSAGRLALPALLAAVAISITGFAVSNDVVSVTVQLVRQSPLGCITGELQLHGTDDLAEGFGLIDGLRLDFGDGDSIFDTAPAIGPVTQTVTVIFDNAYNPEKFFKAAIEWAIVENPDDPWEPEDPEDPENQ